MRKFRLNRKGVSPVIAVLLMIAIAVAASILVYVWSMGLIGTLQAGGGEQTAEQVIMEAYSWNSTDLTLYLKNVGTADVVVDAIYVGGTQITTTETLTVLGPSVTITVSPGSSFTEGVAYTIKVFTKTGGIFTYSCIYGKAG